MNKFTASNGVTVRVDDVGNIFEPFRPPNEVTLTPKEADALREFFQHERDEELGRWRWPENPTCVVREGEPTGDFGSGRTVYVFHEETFDRFHFNERVMDACSVESVAKRAARAYFEAHPTPEPKPWENAKAGEAWVIECPAGPVVAYRRFDGHFYDYEGNQLFLDRVDSARRIWPEP